MIDAEKIKDRWHNQRFNDNANGVAIGRDLEYERLLDYMVEAVNEELRQYGNRITSLEVQVEKLGIHSRTFLHMADSMRVSIQNIGNRIAALENKPTDQIIELGDTDA